MASTFSKLNSELRHVQERCDDEKEKEALTFGAKVEGQDDDEEAKRERDEIRRMLRKENERNRRREQAGLHKTKGERDQDRDISEKIALG